MEDHIRGGHWLGAVLQGLAQSDGNTCTSTVLDFRGGLAAGPCPPAGGSVCWPLSTMVFRGRICSGADQRSPPRPGGASGGASKCSSKSMSCVWKPAHCWVWNTASPLVICRSPAQECHAAGRHGVRSGLHRCFFAYNPQSYNLQSTVLNLQSCIGASSRGTPECREHDSTNVPRAKHLRHTSPELNVVVVAGVIVNLLSGVALLRYNVLFPCPRFAGFPGPGSPDLEQNTTKQRFCYRA